MRLRLPLALALWMVILVTASASAHGRVFIGAGVGAPRHRITVVPSAVVISPGVVKVSPIHGHPPAVSVVTPHRAIRPGTPVIVARPSDTFFGQTVVVSPPVQGTFPPHVTVPRRGIGPKVIIVAPTGSASQR
jgi:hypothetical protein